MTPLLIGIVGSKNTGKTTFTLKCSKLLGNYGIDLSVIKFSSSGYSLEPEGKDSNLFRNTPANPIIFTSPFETVTYKRVSQRSGIQDILKLIPESSELVLCESYPASFPQIPLIYIIKDFHDFKNTKVRYNNQEPILIIESLPSKEKSTSMELRTLSIDLEKDIQEITEKILSQLKSV